MTDVKPRVTQGRRLSVVWILPLAAFVLGAWALFYAFLNEGPDVKVRFDTAEGLEAGKTKVKFREVDVGVVTEVRLIPDHDGVMATLKLHKETEPLLREGTRFWVVTARVGGGAVSGLETLLSGAYIEFYPGDGDTGAREFTALNTPPLTEVGAPGLRLQLLSSRAHSLGPGDPVLFHGYKVGRVERQEFDLKLRKIRYQVFVDAPYHELVDSSARFWDVSGVSVSASADGFKFNAGSLETLLLGGVTFGWPDGFEKGTEVEAGTEFKLYASQDEIHVDPYRYGMRYVVAFKQSVRGLRAGAPVEYRGIPLGYVEKVMVEDIVSNGEVGSETAIPVLIYVEPGRLQAGDNPEMLDVMREAFRSGVKNGLRASLATGNYLTGSLYVDIDFIAGAPPAEIGSYRGYETLPTVEGAFGRMGQQVADLMEKINGLPLGDTVTGANAALAELTASLAAMRELLEEEKTRALTGELEALLVELRNVLGGVAPDSPVYRTLDASLRELNRTLLNITDFTDTLSTKPNALVLPIDLPPDPIPEARP